ncbi:hypothetical protein OAJ27_00250 [bacterium]|nr:hypothetical protein [bacterium]
MITGPQKPFHFPKHAKHTPTPKQKKDYVKSSKNYTAPSTEILATTLYASQEVEKKRKKERESLEELNQIWQFLQSPLKGSVMDVYDYLHDIKEGNSTTVSQTAESILDFLDSTRMRGW